MKRVFLAMMAFAAVAFTGCNKEGNEQPISNSPAKRVEMKIAGVQTRAVGDIVGTKPAILKGGYIVFYDGNNKIVHQLPFGAGQTVTAAQLLAGVSIENVPGGASQVFVYGNIPSEVTFPSTGSYKNNVDAIAISVASQKDLSEGVDMVTLSGGTATLTTQGAGDDLVYQASFKIYPLASRIEIEDIAFTGAIASAKVDGIFINNYYNDVKLNRAKTANLIHNGEGGAEVYGDNVAPYVPGFPMYDFSAAGLTATAGKAWYYNVLAPEDNTTESAHVIIRLSNVVSNDVNLSFPGIQYATIRGFKDGATVITALQAGKVYNLKTLSISHDKLSPKAESEDKTFVVDAEVDDWTTIDVTPDW